MKYEEALEKIDFLLGGYQMLIDENIGNGAVVGHDVRGTWKADTSCIDAYKDLINACETAKQALEKQIPKKPLKIKGEYKDEFICPACKSEKVMTECDPFLDYGLNYCNNCGQKLDWSEGNENDNKKKT